MALGFIVFPKSTFEEVSEGVEKRCECFGSEFWYGTRCVGLRTGCEIHEKSKDRSACEERTCEEFFALVEEARGDRKGSAVHLQGMDVVLVMDASKSMEGERLAATKRASKQLVENLEAGERVSIVIFSDYARVLHNFSSNKTSLTEAIDSLELIGGTEYLPGLREAASMFNEEREAKRGVIFLSDGDPSDDRDDVLEFSRDLQEDGIVLFTIGFGDEQTSDILERMIVSDVGSLDVNRRYLHFDDAGNIVSAFSAAWEEISNIDVFRLEPTFDEGFFASSADEGVRVLMGDSVVTGTDVPGGVCAPGLEVEARTSEGDGFSLEPEGDRFIIPKDALAPGTHDLSVTSTLRLNHNGTCVFSGSKSVENMTVWNASCERMSCEDARGALEDFDVAARAGALLPRSRGYGRVAIMVDSSESMGPHLRNVRRAADRVNRLLAKGDRRALLSFADGASLIQPLTRVPDELTASLEGIRPQGTTRLVPALEKVGFLFEEHREGDVAVMLTDGEFHDRRGEEDVAAAFESLVGSGTCLYIVGYGSWLGEAEHRAMFRDAARLSQRELSCGGFTYAPDSEELSSMVVDMFGGARSGNDSLRVVVDRDSSVKSRLSFDVKVVSRVTGLELPYEAGGRCIPFPPVEVEVRHDGEEVPVDTWKVSEGEVRATTPYLSPGSYDVLVEAGSPISGCDLSGSFSNSFSVVALPDDPSEQVVFLLVLVTAGLLVWCGRRLQKSFQA